MIIGGKDEVEEAERIASMNILIATPRRLLQHIGETPSFDVSSVQILGLNLSDIIDSTFSFFVIIFSSR
jgi:ATP-dependent RNA helicase DDX10/DBP4